MVERYSSFILNAAKHHICGYDLPQCCKTSWWRTFRGSSEQQRLPSSCCVLRVAERTGVNCSCGWKLRTLKTPAWDYSPCISTRAPLHTSVKNQYCECSENRSSLSVFPEKADARPLTWLKTPRTGERKRCSVVEVFPCSQVGFFSSPSDVQHSCFSAESDRDCSCRPSRAQAFKYLVRYFRCPPPPPTALATCYPPPP